MDNHAILAFPRDVLPAQAFIEGKKLAAFLNDVQARAVWIARPSAEASNSLVQLIPSCILRQGGRFLTLRRIDAARSDLRNRFTIVVGGHMEYSPSYSAMPLERVLRSVLQRELLEELDVRPALAPPSAVVIDHSSVRSSRHVAVLHEVEVSPQDITVRAEEEFQLGAHTVRFRRPDELKRIMSHTDPWSRIILTQHVLPIHGGHLWSYQSINRRPGG